MKVNNRLTIAIQKSGRLNTDSLDLLNRCGLKIRVNKGALLCRVENLPIDILMVRDDDIPTFVMDEVSDLGIVGENVLFEQTVAKPEQNIEVIKKLGFGRCRLSIAMSDAINFTDASMLAGKKIATSYPNLLAKYLAEQNVKAQIIAISGSVEIAPSLGMADAICDLVSTGRTLEEHSLKEAACLVQSQAVLIQSKTPLSVDKQQTLDLLLRRIEGVLKAQESKYIMFHAPKACIDAIKKLLPGCETPTIMPLEGSSDKVAVHAVAGEGVFWDTLEDLKQAGASSILVLPIEKMMN